MYLAHFNSKFWCPGRPFSLLLNHQQKIVLKNKTNRKCLAKWLCLNGKIILRSEAHSWPIYSHGYKNVHPDIWTLSGYIERNLFTSSYVPPMCAYLVHIHFVNINYLILVFRLVGHTSGTENRLHGIGAVSKPGLHLIFKLA